MTTSVLDGLFDDDRALTDVARAAAGLSQGNVEVLEIDLDPVPLTNMTTTALGRVRGTVEKNGVPEEWSVVVKVVQSPEHSPIWEEIPPPLRADVLTDLAWRSEPQLYRSPVAQYLPGGLRMPAVYRIDELDETHVAMWMEDVAHHSGTWSTDDYRQAARLLGRMSGRIRENQRPPGVELIRRDLRGYFSGRVMHAVLPVLSDDATWTHTVLAESVDAELQADLIALSRRAPAILDLLDALPCAMSHGDACPQNLLRSARDGTIVAIDWQFVSLNSVGFDAGQVVAGHAESGDLDPDRLAATFDAVLEGYSEGLRAEGADVPDEHVRAGAIGAFAIRSAFTAIPLELLHIETDPTTERVIRDRCRYARFIVDLASTIS